MLPEITDVRKELDNEDGALLSLVIETCNSRIADLQDLAQKRATLLRRANVRPAELRTTFTPE